MAGKSSAAQRQSKKPEVERDAHGRVVRGTPNPGGLTREQRQRRKSVSDALERAFTRADGTDELVDAIVAGVRERDSTCLKLACDYRWGKPVQRVEIAPEEMEDHELRRAVADVVEQWRTEGALQ